MTKKQEDDYSRIIDMLCVLHMFGKISDQCLMNLRTPELIEKRFQKLKEKFGKEKNNGNNTEERTQKI